MDIHKPKPIHSWRELGTEIGVIVIGILIALGLEQAVEDYHARSELEETRSVIEGDLTQALASASMIEQSARCRERQFVALNEAVSRGDLARANTLLRGAHLYTALPVSDAVWTSALASGVTFRFTPVERASYGGAYFLARQQTAFQVEFFRSQARFSNLVGSELSAAPDAADRALGELVEMEAIAANSRGVMAELRRNAARVLGEADARLEEWQTAFVAECEAAAASMDEGQPAT